MLDTNSVLPYLQETFQLSGGMSFFAKTKKKSGYLAVVFQDDGISAAHIVRNASQAPEVELLAFYPLGQAAADGILAKLGKELNAVRYQCGTILASNEYQLLSVDAPNVPLDELKTAIRWRVKDMLDFHVDDATIDVLDVPVDKQAGARNHSMYVVAARNSLIEKRQAMFAEAKLPLSVIDIPEMAQRNISALLEPEGRGIAMLSFDEKGGLLTVTFSGELYLARRIDVPLAQVQQTSAEDQRACFERITLELQRSLDHFDRQYHFITIAKLLLAPLGGSDVALKEYLAGNLYVAVDTLNLDDVLNLSKVPDLKSPAAQQRHFMALGAALRHEEKAL